MITHLSNFRGNLLHNKPLFKLVVGHMSSGVPLDNKPGTVQQGESTAAGHGFTSFETSSDLFSLL